MPRRPVDAELLEHETIGDVLDCLAELYRVPVDRLSRIPVVVGFLSAVIAAQAVRDYTELGHPRERAIEAAASELGISSETIRTQIKRARRVAFTTSEKKVQIEPTSGRKAA